MTSRAVCLAAVFTVAGAVASVRALRADADEPLAASASNSAAVSAPAATSASSVAPSNEPSAPSSTSSTSSPTAVTTATASSAPPGPPARLEPPPKKPVWPTATLGAVGLAGIGVGIALQVVAAEKLVPVDGTPCPGGEKTCPPAVKEAVDAHNAISAGGLGSFVAGSVALAAMVVYVLVPWSPARSPAHAVVVPWAAPRSGGLVVGGSF